jgi:hypothetical protein
MFILNNKWNNTNKTENQIDKKINKKNKWLKNIENINSLP